VRLHASRLHCRSLRHRCARSPLPAPCWPAGCRGSRRRHRWGCPRALPGSRAPSPPSRRRSPHRRTRGALRAPHQRVHTTLAVPARTTDGRQLWGASWARASLLRPAAALPAQAPPRVSARHASSRGRCCPPPVTASRTGCTLPSATRRRTCHARAAPLQRRQPLRGALRRGAVRGGSPRVGGPAVQRAPIQRQAQLAGGGHVGHAAPRAALLGGTAPLPAPVAETGLEFRCGCIMLCG